jgi:hypothetical protein
MIGPGLEGIRKRWLGRAVEVLLGACVFTARAKPALAEQHESPVIEYQAPEGCPLGKDFSAEVARRREVEPRESEPRSFHVQLLESPDGYSGVLRVRAFGSESSIRSVQAKTCEEVSVALALVTALTLDSAPPEPPETPRPVRRRVRAPKRPEPPDALGMQSQPEAQSWWGVGFHLDALAGALPSIRPSARLFVDARLEGSGLWAPSVRLSAARARYRPTPELDLIWTVGRLDLCLTNVQVSTNAMLWPCPVFEAGNIATIRAGGIERDHPSRLWLSVGGVARIQWILFNVLLFDIEGGVTFPLAHRTLPAADGTPIHQISAVAGHIGAGLGARFP